MAKEILVEGLGKTILLKEINEIVAEDIPELVIFPYPRQEMMAEMCAQQPIELLLESVEIDVENDPDVIEVVDELDKVYVTMSEIREVCLARRRQMEEQGKHVSDEQFHRIVLEAVLNTFPQLNEAGAVLGALKTATGFVGGVVKGIGTGVKAAVAKIGPMAKAAWSTIKDVSAKAWQGITKIAGTSWDAIKATAGEWGPKLKGAWAGAKDLVGGGIDKIKAGWAEYSPKLKSIATSMKGKAADLAKNFKALKAKAPAAIEKAASSSGLHSKDMAKIKALLSDPGALEAAINAGSAGGGKANPQAIQFAMMMPFIMMMMTMMQAQGAAPQQVAAGRIISKSRVQTIIDEEVRKQLGIIKG